MNHYNNAHQSVNTPQASPQWPVTLPSREGLGDQPEHAQELRVRHPYPERSGTQGPGSNLGGQHRLSTFGVGILPKYEAKRQAIRDAALASLDPLAKLKARFARQDAAKRQRDAVRDAGLFSDEPKATGAQNLVAAATDAREAYPHIRDDEHADFLLRCEGAGYVETQTAIEA